MNLLRRHAGSAPQPVHVRHETFKFSRASSGSRMPDSSLWRWPLLGSQATTAKRQRRERGSINPDDSITGAFELAEQHVCHAVHSGRRLARNTTPVAGARALRRGTGKHPPTRPASRVCSFLSRRPLLLPGSSHTSDPSRYSS